MQIAKRTKNGWTERQENINKEYCDDCNKRLWIAPDGETIYCDNMSDKHKDIK